MEEKPKRELRLRQIALVARDLEHTLDDLSAVLGLPEPYRDPGVGVFGLANGVFPIGDTFLEVVSPVRERTSAGRFLERRGGDGGYMVIVQSNRIETERNRLEGMGVRIVWETALEDIATLHIHPADIGGAIVSVDAAVPPASWRWAGPGWETKPASKLVAEIVGVEIEAADPEAMARRWARVLGCRSPGRVAERIEVELDRGRIGFVAGGNGRGEGIRALEVAVSPRTPDAVSRVLAAARARGVACQGSSLSICGTEIRLLESTV